MSLQAAIERSAAPGAVRVAVERLTEADPGLGARLQEDAGLRSAIVAVTAASRSLTELLLSEPEALDVLGDLDRRLVLDSGDDLHSAQGAARALGRWKRLELLRIAARDLLG